MNRVKLVEDVIKNINGRVENIRLDDIQAYYIASYLPIMVDCLASIADSLEKIADKKECTYKAETKKDEEK